MSFILDALKKSEIERQRQSVPGLIDATHLRRRSRLPGWAIALGVLLAVNLLVLTFVFMTRRGALVHSPEPSRAQSTPAQPMQVTPVPETAAEPPKPFSPLDPAPVFAPEIPVAPLASPSPAVVHHPRRADPVLTDTDAGPESQEVLPSMSEINLTGSQKLPELHLDVHVYATKPSERFVYINMRKYHEGATLQEGPALERIRRDGVVLNYQGLRFVLPRQP